MSVEEKTESYQRSYVAQSILSGLIPEEQFKTVERFGSGAGGPFTLKLCNSEHIRKLVNLTHLTLHQSDISDISFVECMPFLTSTVFPSNKISDVSPLFRGPNAPKLLKRVDLGDNLIQDMSSFKGNDSVEELVLHSNLITDIEWLSGNTTLLHLDLMANGKVDDKGLLVLGLFPSFAPLTGCRLIQLLVDDVPYGGWDVLDSLKQFASLSVRFRHHLDLVRAESWLTTSKVGTSGKVGKHLSVSEPFGFYANRLGIFCVGKFPTSISLGVRRDRTISNIIYSYFGPEKQELFCNLAHLRLYGNITGGFQFLKWCTSLETLVVEENEYFSDLGLRHLNCRKTLTKLKLDVISKLSDVSVLGTGFSALTKLVLRVTAVKDVSFLERCPSITKLVMDSNEIADISPLVHLKRLEYLDISYNPIQDLDCIKSLKELRFFHADLYPHVSRNTASAFTCLFAGNTTLTNFDADICDEDLGRDATQALEQRAREQADLNHANKRNRHTTLFDKLYNLLFVTNNVFFPR